MSRYLKEAPKRPHIVGHGEVVGPLSAKLSFELLVRDDTFGDHQLRQSIGHCQIAHDEFFESNCLFLWFVGHLLSRGSISGKRNTLAMAIPVSPCPLLTSYLNHGPNQVDGFQLLVSELPNAALARSLPDRDAPIVPFFHSPILLLLDIVFDYGLWRQATPFDLTAY